MAIIGISGKKQHGKDTVASIIEYITDEYYHHNQLVTPFEDWSKIRHSGYLHYWQKKQFAGKLKEVVALIIGCEIHQLEDNNFKEKELGEEWRVWYVSYYKLKFDSNPHGRVSSLYVTKEEAEDSRERIKQKSGDTLQIESYILTPRLLLQYIGTDCGRNIIHPNVWVNATLANYQPITSHQKENGKYLLQKQNYAERKGNDYFVPERSDIPEKMWGTKVNSLVFTWYEEHDQPIYPNWIITDVRFPNEAKVIKDKGGIVIRVNRECIGSTDNHLSETALDDYKDFDYVIANNGNSIDTLIGTVEQCLKSFKII